jgi:hypothetical protein
MRWDQAIHDDHGMEAAVQHIGNYYSGIEQILLHAGCMAGKVLLHEPGRHTLCGTDRSLEFGSEPATIIIIIIIYYYTCMCRTYCTWNPTQA